MYVVLYHFLRAFLYQCIIASFYCYIKKMTMHMVQNSVYLS